MSVLFLQILCTKPVQELLKSKLPRLADRFSTARAASPSSCLTLTLRSRDSSPNSKSSPVADLSPPVKKARLPLGYHPLPAIVPVRVPLSKERLKLASAVYKARADARQANAFTIQPPTQPLAHAVSSLCSSLGSAGTSCRPLSQAETPSVGQVSLAIVSTLVSDLDILGRDFRLNLPGRVCPSSASG